MLDFEEFEEILDKMTQLSLEQLYTINNQAECLINDRETDVEYSEEEIVYPIECDDEY